MKQWLIILISLFLIPAYSENLCLAQTYNTTSAKALKYYNADLTAFDYIDSIHQ